jgi:MarR family transcriptional regulator, organic hydroperoxide resistance regulator
MSQPQLPPSLERARFLEQQPTYWLKRCYQALRRTVEAELRPYSLTLSQRDVLLILHHDGPQDQASLREQLGLEQSSVSRLIDGLVQRRLVELGAGRSDRRIRVATLTSEGEQTLRQTPGSSALGGELMVQDLTPDEKNDLVRLLRQCAHNLSDDSQKGPAAGRRTIDGNRA